MKSFKLNSKIKKYTNLSLGYCTGIVFLLTPVLTRAQADIHFSQFYETSILRNPALTGVFGDDYKLGVYYRNQWSSITNPYNTVLVSAESHVPVNDVSDDFFSFGVLCYADKAGSINQKITSFYPAVNYNKCLSPDHNRYLSVGFTAGYLQYSFDPGKTTFNNQYQGGKYDPANPSLETLPNAKMSIWDLAAGLNYNTSSGDDNNITYIMGISAYHFTQPKFSYYQKAGITQNMRININGAVNSIITDKVTMSAQANYAMQGTYRELMIGGMVNWTGDAMGPQSIFVLSGGLFYRYGDAIIPVIKVAYKSLSMGVSYDVNLSTLKEASNMQGGYEVTLFYTGNYHDKGIVKKTVCPKY